MSPGLFDDSEGIAASASAEWPDAETADRCSLHRLIEELSTVQRRLGTPLEQADDFLQVRSLGSAISEILGRLER
ncbi:MAG TPA: hypothetical protein VIM69_05570 [Opitutaceae bacterium]